MILINSNLDTFLAIIETKTVTSAAIKLGLTQTAVTQRLKALESDLGLSLFTRSRTGMRLTSEGEVLHRYCLEAKSLEGRLLAGIGKQGEFENLDFTIVGPAHLFNGRIISQCRHIYEKWPSLNIRLLVDVNANRLNHLKRGTADLALIMPREVTNELDSKMIKPVEYVLVATSKWNHRSLIDILENERLIAYHPDDIIGSDYLKTFQLEKKLKRNKLYVNENQAFIKMIIDAIGFGVLPKELAMPLRDQNQVRFLNQGRHMDVHFALAWYPRAEMPNYFKEFVKSIK